ncbi:MAG TPA: PaaI family thioesterase [Streptosporangiaceae bacterium]|nr:PaaI family thioesterase [Streptosporangiaceae bacterium]
MTATSAGLSVAQLLAQQNSRTAGLVFLQAIKGGELPPPPIAELLGFRIEALQPGVVTFALDPGEQHYNPIGVVHGGVAATLLDTVMGCALHTLLPPGTAYTTLDISVRFVRPVTTDTGTVLATGTVLHRGRRTATAEARLFAAASGQLLAHGTSSLLVLS